MEGIDAIRLMTQQLLGEAPPPPAGTPGRVIRSRDEPIPAELLALVLGISRQLAHQRLQKARHG